VNTSITAAAALVPSLALVACSNTPFVEGDVGPVDGAISDLGPAGPDGGAADRSGSDSGRQDSEPAGECAATPHSLERFAAPLRTTASGRTFTGWGGTLTARPSHRAPVIFVHGNGGSASGWKSFRAELCAAGYDDAEIWAITFQDNDCSGACSSGSNTEHAEELARLVELVRAQTSAAKVNIVAVSMGVTTARHYIKYLGGVAKHEVGLAYLVSGPNHGLSLCAYPASLINVACEELDASALESGWLHELNTPDETPDGQGDGLSASETIIYRTVSFTEDPFFPGSYVDSPKLEGADNLVHEGDQHAAIDIGDLLSYLGQADPVF